VLVRVGPEVQEVPRGLTGRLTRDLARIVAAGSLAAAVVGTLGALRIWQQGAVDERAPADAIVVLGAAQYDGRPSAVFAARLAHAVELYRDGVAPYLVVTGGRRPGDRTTEADVARRYATARGVPPEAIFGEDEATNTLDSLRLVAAELRDRGLRSAVFVSDPTHMLRVLRIAGDLGLDAQGSPTPSSPVQRSLTRRLRATVHELGALAIYFVTGRATDEEPPV